MGLLDKLLSGQTTLTPYNGNNPNINLLATNQSPLHDNYSITGNGAENVNNLYQQYLDGTGNLLPTPSQLDLGGNPPSISPSGQALPYTLNQPQ